MTNSDEKAQNSRPAPSWNTETMRGRLAWLAQFYGNGGRATDLDSIVDGVTAGRPALNDSRDAVREVISVLVNEAGIFNALENSDAMTDDGLSMMQRGAALHDTSIDARFVVELVLEGLRSAVAQG